MQQLSRFPLDFLFYFEIHHPLPVSRRVLPHFLLTFWLIQVICCTCFPSYVITFPVQLHRRLSSLANCSWSDLLVVLILPAWPDLIPPSATCKSDSDPLTLNFGDWILDSGCWTFCCLHPQLPSVRTWILVSVTHTLHPPAPVCFWTLFFTFCYHWLPLVYGLCPFLDIRFSTLSA